MPVLSPGRKQIGRAIGNLLKSCFLLQFHGCLRVSKGKPPPKRAGKDYMCLLWGCSIHLPADAGTHCLGNAATR